MKYIKPKGVMMAFSGPLSKATVKLLLAYGFIASAPTAISAEDSAFKWANNSISLLTGAGFELPGNNVSTLTFEHTSAWSWGGVFGFLDVTDYHDNSMSGGSWYGELSPRFSLGNLAGLELSEGGLVRDILIATTWERGRGGVEALLIGAGVDLNISGFRFFQVNIYAHHAGSFDVGADDMQVTLSWGRPFEIGGQKFAFDGFLDYELGLGNAVPNLHLVPQIKWDIGANWGKAGKLYLGTEIDIWRNQYGLRNNAAFDTHQTAFNLLLKAHF